MEKLVHTRRYSFLEKNCLLFERQYGFSNKLSTNNALIDIAGKSKLPVTKVGLLVVNITYVDFKKTFDIDNHKFLLHKSNHCGIRGAEI